MMQPRIQKKYHEEVFESLFKDFNYPNKMMVPKLAKIVLNTSMSDAISNVKLLHAAAKELTLITGQKNGNH
jgi:large subunit ribosomal protein L5